jgi:hypothetical protein
MGVPVANVSNGAGISIPADFKTEPTTENPRRYWPGVFSRQESLLSGEVVVLQMLGDRLRK